MLYRLSYALGGGGEIGGRRRGVNRAACLTSFAQRDCGGVGPCPRVAVPRPREPGLMTQDPRLPFLAELERKVLWLSTWTIHNANHLRASGDGLKVGGHQASSASLATIMTALYFAALRPED